MAVSFTNISWWMWSSKEKEKVPNNGTSSSLNSTSDWGLSVRESVSENVKFRSVGGAKMASSRKVKRKWQSREKRRIDREYDAVLVPSDGTCLSGSESDDSDWSIGWLEPHGDGFQGEDHDGIDNSFAVLVPCYGSKEVVQGANVQFLSAIKDISNDYAAEGKKLMEQWLSSLHN